MTTEYLDLRLRTLRQVRDEAMAEYRKLAGIQIKIQRWSANEAERAAAQSAYMQLKHRLDALDDRLEFLDAVRRLIERHRIARMDIAP